MHVRAHSFTMETERERKRGLFFRRPPPPPPIDHFLTVMEDRERGRIADGEEEDLEGLTYAVK